MRKFGKSDEAFTGLEAAIVLIAFVVVAAVFSYVMLGAGFFTSQKSQEVVHTGVQQAASNVELAGSLQANATGTGASAELSWVKFQLQTAAGGEAVDVNKTTYVVSTNETISQLSATQIKNGTFVGGLEDDDFLLEAGEFYQVTLDVSALNLVAYRPFSIEVHPPVGTVLTMERNAPASLSSGEWYELY